ncbi:MAG TPA: YIP1 family protein [Candidatus Dormibacteraeota bacterium]|nr:YIP1 family protein [Candidatus Dormibacteraeota bacterium]
MATLPVSAPQTQAKLSPIARVVGVFFSPKATFEDIARKPDWILPVILLTIFSTAVCVAINQRTNWREFIGHQIEQSSRGSQLPPEQKQQQIEGGAKIAPILTYVFGIPGPLILVLVVAGVMMGAYNLSGSANVNYQTSLGIVSHAFLASLVSSVLFLVVLFLKAPGSVDLENPLATNPAAFLPEDSAKWVVNLCKSIDLFSIWTLLLIAIGFAATNSKKLKGSKSFVIAFAVWGTFVLLRVGWAFIFS